MKRVLLFLVAMTSFSAFAQEAEPAPAGLTPDQVELIRSNLRGIYDVMGASQADGKKAAPAADQKSLADVADKALNLMSGLVVKVAGTLEKVAPKFWTIMVRQQYAKAIADTIVPCALAAFGFVVLVLLKKRMGWPDLEKRSWDDEDWIKLWVGIIVPGLFSFICFWVSAYHIAEAAKFVINPEFYAVRDILMMFTRPGSM